MKVGEWEGRGGKRGKEDRRRRREMKWIPGCQGG